MTTDWKSAKTEIGSSAIYPNPKPAPGHAVWIEHGVWFTAPEIDAAKFGPHLYDNGDGIGHCECGCYMGGCSSSGPVDPFGPCPMNPNPFV